MPKIKRPALFSEYFKIDKELMNMLNLFNPVLNVDTNLFVDPLLLKRSQNKIISENAVNQYKEKFSNIINLLSISEKIGDVAWRSALKLLPKKEVEGTCLGYGTNSISGRSIAEKVREHVIRTASEIVKLGIKDPEIFVLLPLFEEGIGPDTISDITTSLIEEALLDFTVEASTKLNLETIDVFYKGKWRKILKNPLKNKLSPIILLPKDILRNLPVVNSRQEIAEAASFNSYLREQVNRDVAKIFKAETKLQRDRAINELLANKQAIMNLLIVIKKGKVLPYDFKKDNYGLIIWQNQLSLATEEYPLEIEKPVNSSQGLRSVVGTIIDQFKFLIEEKGLNKLLWNTKNEPHKEKVVQMIFFAIAYSYCGANDIDINPEMDTGSGMVDFKFSNGFNKRVIVEIKNSYNPNIISGLTKQLQIYKSAEETSNGYYIIVDVGRMGKKLENLYLLLNKDDDKKSEIIYINGNKKPSASKRK